LRPRAERRRGAGRTSRFGRAETVGARAGELRSERRAEQREKVKLESGCVQRKGVLHDCTRRRGQVIEVTRVNPEVAGGGSSQCDELNEKNMSTVRVKMRSTEGAPCKRR